MKAIGKNIDGEKVVFKISNKSVYCYNNKLTELNIPNGVESVFCHNNKLTALHLPNGVENVNCSNNQLTELRLPDSVEKVYFDKNPIKEITLPKSIRLAVLPLNCNVLNIDEFKNRTDLYIKFR